MRAPADQPSRDAAAMDEARHQLRPLFFNVISWTERGPITNNPKTEFEAALALVECFVNDDALHAPTLPPYVSALAKLVREAAVPVLRRGRPSKGRHGHSRDLNASRDQKIAETVASISKQFELSQEQASTIVSEALTSLVLEHRRVLIHLAKKKNADPAWIEECRERVDKLSLGESRVQYLAKKYRM